MKLYGMPGACSMSCHIAFAESGIPVEVILNRPQEVEKLNPAGAVPILVFDDGKVLTQNIAILAHLATLAPQLLPKPGTYEYTQAFQWLSWTASDVHPAFAPLWGDASDEQKKQTQGYLRELFARADEQLSKNAFIAGNQFTIADPYFFTVFGWMSYLKVPNEDFKNIHAYVARMSERPAVIAVLKKEGLLR